MSFSPIQEINKTFITLVRGSSDWNDVIESNTDFLEDASDTIKTKDSQSIPMFVECCVAYEALTNPSTSAATWRFALKSSEDVYKCGQMRGWRGGSYVVGDDKCIATDTNTFTYNVINGAGTNYTSFTVVPEFSSTIVFFPRSI